MQGWAAERAELLAHQQQQQEETAAVRAQLQELQQLKDDADHKVRAHAGPGFLGSEV